MHRNPTPALLVALTTVLACGGGPAADAAESQPVHSGTELVVRDTMLPDLVVLSATTEPMSQATLSSRLMARVTMVSVREGDVVPEGALLVRLDDSDLAAKRQQAEASLLSAEAAFTESQLHAARLRALFADSAAPRAHVDAAEAGLARAEQGVRAARAGVAELDAVAGYATIVAPFAGVVTQRLVDPGALAAPGSPLLRIEDPTRLRVVASASPVVATPVRRGARLNVSIEGEPGTGVVEGVVPSAGVALLDIQVVVDNHAGRFASGSAAAITIEGAPRATVLVPSAAIVRSGDLTGVRVRGATAVSTRWIRLGRTRGDHVEVLAGLAAGETIIVPPHEAPGA